MEIEYCLHFKWELSIFLSNEKNTFMEFVNWYRMAIFWKVQYDREKKFKRNSEINK